MNRKIICDNGCKDRLTKLFGHDPETDSTKFDGEYCKTDRIPYSNWEPGYIKARREG